MGWACRPSAHSSLVSTTREGMSPALRTRCLWTTGCLSCLSRSGRAAAAFPEDRRVGCEKSWGVQTGRSQDIMLASPSLLGKGHQMSPVQLPSLLPFPKTASHATGPFTSRGSAVIKARAVSVQPRPKHLTGSRCSVAVCLLPASLSTSSPNCQTLFPIEAVSSGRLHSTPNGGQPLGL